MKNRKIKYAHQQAKIYAPYYKPSFNLLRFVKSILCVLLFGSGTVAKSYIPLHNKPRRRA
ncbi:MAG: hypothetical protein M3342_08695 [Bacteroidota bacterium]|nr:hypothetical protein [Bacteroidota bacterium]